MSSVRAAGGGVGGPEPSACEQEASRRRRRGGGGVVGARPGEHARPCGVVGGVVEGGDGGA